MEEGSSENEAKQRSLLYYVSDTQANGGREGLRIGENAPRQPVPRYWHTSVGNGARPSNYNPYKKVNTPYNPFTVKNNSLTVKNNTATVKNNTPTVKNNTPLINNSKTDGTSVKEDTSKPKEEKTSPGPSPLPPHLSLFQTSNPQHIKKTIELLDTDEDNIVQLASSDEDEVVEVALPPKPTITIESSDDEEVTLQLTPFKGKGKEQEREISTSPVPSVVSSVSDEFIRTDCITLNIFSRHPDNHSFDFSLHGADLVVTPSKKKKKKKNKENMNTTSTPIVSTPSEKSATNATETCFATPKTKAKNKKLKKLFTVSEKTLPSVDVYDSDSNQSAIDMPKADVYKVTEKSLPSADVYETDSNTSEAVKDHENSKKPATEAESSDSSAPEKPPETVADLRNLAKDNASNVDKNDKATVIDLTLTEDRPIQPLPPRPKTTKTDIQENIVMGNVTGFTESEDYGEPQINHTKPDVSKFASTKVPAILYENLDFDNLKGKDMVCRSKQFSLDTLRAEMEKFYNESWGGEDFNHRELQKHMSRDKSLWAIDPKDRMPSSNRKKVICNYCNRPGHRDDTCNRKPPVCYMCGATGHVEPRCPSKICVNCGAPNQMYSTQCRNCAIWCRITCAECGQMGHPSSHCPDVWRRYHNTTDLSLPLEENHQKKNYQKLFCSGCTKRGHLVHTCRLCIPFSGLPINSPYVRYYRPIYPPIQYNRQNNHQSQTNNYKQRSIQDKIPNNQGIKSPYHKPAAPDSTISPAASKNERHKRPSKSPTVHEDHSNKKRNMSSSDGDGRNAKSPGPPAKEPQRKLSQSKEQETREPSVVAKEAGDTPSAPAPERSTAEPEKAPDFIPIFSSNRDKMGQIIQDNEVSDTSDIVTSAKIYITNEIIDKLKTEEGQQWMKETSERNKVIVENSQITAFVSITGKVADQDSFQAALKDWAKKSNMAPSNADNTVDAPQNPEENQSSSGYNLPRNRLSVIRELRKSLDSLNMNLGEPKDIYKNLNFLQNRHKQLLGEKVVSEKQVSKNRQHIKKALKSLNMVLLGQAGLADGSTHLRELHALHDRLMNIRQKNINGDLRKEVCYHYYTIFTDNPRNDYDELLRIYYQKPSKKPFWKEKKYVRAINPKKKAFNTIPPFPAPQRSLPPLPELAKVGGAVNNSGNFAKRNALKAEVVNANYHKLVFYYKRLSQARPFDAILKKTKADLGRKLHAYISSLGNSNNTATAKTLKKVRKVQEQAQVFLNNLQCKQS